MFEKLRGDTDPPRMLAKAVVPLITDKKGQEGHNCDTRGLLGFAFLDVNG